MQAVRGGRRIRPGYRGIIGAQARRLPEMYRLKEERGYREQLSGQREREIGLTERGQKLQEKQARVATGISAAQVGATGYMARQMTAGGAPSAGESVAWTGRTGGGAPAGAGIGGYAGTAGAGYVAGRYVGAPVGEKAIPTSVVKGGRSRRRWGGMAAGAGAGAAYGTMVAPGVGTGVGAVIGGIAGLIGAW